MELKGGATTWPTVNMAERQTHQFLAEQFSTPDSVEPFWRRSVVATKCAVLSVGVSCVARQKPKVRNSLTVATLYAARCRRAGNISWLGRRLEGNAHGAQCAGIYIAHHHFQLPRAGVAIKGRGQWQALSLELGVPASLAHVPAGEPIFSDSKSGVM